VLEEGVENEIHGKGEERRGTQKTRRRKDSMVHHTPKKNKVDWPPSETQPLRGKYNGRKN
jgi:hypothetical protein